MQILRTFAIAVLALAIGGLATGGGATETESAPATAAPAAPAAGPKQNAETLARLEAYLNQITTLHARFVQVSSNGAFAEGDLYLDRPGRLRFEYDPPHPALLIANGLTLLYYDRDLEQATFLPLWETPLWFLIRERVDLSDGLEVVDITQGAAVIKVTVRGADDEGEAEVTLVFADRPISLHSWEIHDAQGITTQVALVNPQFGVSIDRALFEHGDLQIHIQPPRDR
jgi:outer membrane lipoprotein-sorting protein